MPRERQSAPRFAPHVERTLPPAPKGSEYKKFHGMPIIVPARLVGERLVDGVHTRAQLDAILAAQRRRDARQAARIVFQEAEKRRFR
jgi:hypothetical protein